MAQTYYSVNFFDEQLREDNIFYLLVPKSGIPWRENSGSERLLLLAEKHCKARISFGKREPGLAHFLYLFHHGYL